jgi:hypothetical protein
MEKDTLRTGKGCGSGVEKVSADNRKSEPEQGGISLRKHKYQTSGLLLQGKESEHRTCFEVYNQTSGSDCYDSQPIRGLCKRDVDAQCFLQVSIGCNRGLHSGGTISLSDCKTHFSKNSMHEVASRCM